jgi:DNA (cytosine-5)-methyltransferase 1
VRTISLCTGIGALELAFPSAELVAYAEVDPAAITVLEREYPGVANLGDITAWPSRIDVDPIALLLAGIPCQGVSEGGRKLGAGDPRWLGTAFLSHVDFYRPREVFLENVEGLTAPRHDAERNAILDGLAALGYSVRWGLMGACAVGAPHCRHRFYLHARRSAKAAMRAANGGTPDVERVTMPKCQKAAALGWLFPSPRAGDGIRGAELKRSARTGTGGTLADAVVQLYLSGEIRGGYSSALERWERITGRPAPTPVEESARTQSGVRLSADFSEWLMGLPEGWVTDGQTRADALRLIGNAVVHRAAAWAYRVLACNH